MKIRLDAWRVLRHFTVALLGAATLLCLGGCGGGVSLRRLGISVNVQGAFTQVYASSAPITLTATLDDDPTSQGVVWTLSLANSSCSPDCGKLTKSPTDPKFSVVYTPPSASPRNTTASITATSIADSGKSFVFNFTILPAIGVTITNKFATQKSGDPSVGLNATVSNDLSNAGVTWTLTVGGKPCPAQACGTLSAPPSPTLTATYTPPATAPIGDNASPTITATSVTDPTKDDSFTFTIVPGITVTIANKFQKQFIGDPSITVNASVDADSANAGVTWTLANANGQACSNCGTLVPNPAPSFAATYTPPTTQPLGADSNPTITAASVTNPTKSDSFSFVISISTKPFKGSYAFLLRGFSDLSSAGAPSLPMAMAGSITLDDQGNVIGGDLDINNDTGITHASGLTGSLAPDSSFNGIVRGTISLTNVVFGGTTTPFPLSFKFVLSSDYSRGRIEELDGALFVNSGTILRQDPAALAAANPTGTYAFGVDSDAPLGGRTVEAGQLILTSNGVSGGLVDESKAGDPTPRYTATPLATSSLVAPDLNGRGTLSLAVAANGSVPASSDQYAYYIVNSGQINLIQIDAAPTFGTVFAGVARAQKPLTASSVNMTSVLQLTGMDAIPPATNGQPGPDVIIGVVTIPNPGGGTPQTFALTFDENDVGKIFTSKATAGALTFDHATGRGTLAEPGSGFGIGFMDLAVFYLSDAGQGFVIDGDISTCVPVTVCPGGQPPNNYPITNNAFSGTLTPQATGIQFNNTSLSGNVIFSSGATAIPNIPSALAGMNLIFNSMAIPPGTYTAKGDLSSLGSQDGNLPDVSFNGTYSVFGDPLGHGLLRLPEQIFGVFPGANQLDSAFFYLIGPNQGVAIGVQPGPGTQPGPFSGVMFLDPQ